MPARTLEALCDKRFLGRILVAVWYVSPTSSALYDVLYRKSLSDSRDVCCESSSGSAGSVFWTYTKIGK